MADYTIYDITVSVLTPLHIGTGRELLNQYDYAIHNGRTWRLNEGALLDAQDVEDAAMAAKLAVIPPAQLLEAPHDYRPDNGLFRYVLHGTPRSEVEGAQLREQIKDVFDRPYLPGSSLKGALRTALAWKIWQERNIRPETNDTGRDYERTIFGRDPNHDLLRALHVSDSTPVNPAHLRILNAKVMNFGGELAAPIVTEAIAQDTKFRLTLKVDEKLFSDWANRDRLRTNGRELLTDLPRSVQNHSLALARQELKWFAGIDKARLISGFYQELVDFPLKSDQFFVRVGWGTGWESKTFGSHLQADDHLMERIVRKFPLSGKKYKKGDLFPKSRRVVVLITKNGMEGPSRPWGWCLVEMKERKRGS